MRQFFRRIYFDHSLKLPVSRDRVSPLEVSSQRLYFDTDSPPGGSVSESIRPPETIFSNKVSGGRNYFNPRRNKLSPGGRVYFGLGLGFHHYRHPKYLLRINTLPCVAGRN